MDVSFDPAKRLETLEHRGLDFLDAPRVFAGDHFTILDDRQDYGEERFLTFGELEGRHVVVVWTWREEGRRIISMRHAHDEEIENRKRALDRPG
jgi:uncharacterized protein